MAEKKGKKETKKVVKYKVTTKYGNHRIGLKDTSIVLSKDRPLITEDEELVKVLRKIPAVKVVKVNNVSK